MQACQLGKRLVANSDSRLQTSKERDSIYLQNYLHNIKECKMVKLNLAINNNKKKNKTSFKVLEIVCSRSPSDIKNVVFKVTECSCESPLTAKRKLLFILLFWIDINAIHAIIEVIQSRLPTCSS